MKIENLKDNGNGFIPVEVVVTLETREEFDAVLYMTRLNMSIPRLAEDETRAKKIREFLDGFRSVIEETQN